MSDIDWSSPARLHERDDGGSDMYYEFRTLKEGSLADLVAHVVALPVDERARLIIDGAVTGSIGVNDILALAARPDFPSAA